MGPSVQRAVEERAEQRLRLDLEAPALGLGQRRLEQVPGSGLGSGVHEGAAVEWHEPAEGDQRAPDARLRVLAGLERVREVGEDRSRAELGHGVGFPAATGMPVSTPRRSLNGARSETSTPLRSDGHPAHLGVHVDAAAP